MKIFNSINFFLGLIWNKLIKKRLPLTVIYNITDRCNARCKYCYLRYYHRGTPEPTTQQIFKVIDELKKNGTQRISLGGGEPLIREDIDEIVKYIKKKGMACVINSNGILVPEKIKTIKKADALCLSLDGPEEIHDLYRGQGSWQKVMSAIKIARENKITLNTNTVLNKSNLEAVEYILDLAKKYGFLAEFNLMIGYLPDKTRSVEPASNQEIKTVIKKILNYKKRGYPILMSSKAYEYALNWPDYRIEEIVGKQPDFKYIECSAGKYFCVIDTDGKVYACPHLIGKVEALSCYQSGFAKAFENLLKHDCHACYQIYHNEFNLLFKLSPAVILNYIKNSLKNLK